MLKGKTVIRCRRGEEVMLIIFYSIHRDFLIWNSTVLKGSEISEEEQISSVGRGNAGTSPLNRKNCCKNLVSSSRVIYFRRGVRNPRNSQEKIWKKSIFHRDFEQKISKFSWIFSNVSSLLVQTRGILHACFLIFPARSKGSFKCWWYFIFLQISAYFLQKFREFSSNFQ